MVKSKVSERVRERVNKETGFAIKSEMSDIGWRNPPICTGIFNISQEKSNIN